jgi:hypothetical protein
MQVEVAQATFVVEETHSPTVSSSPAVAVAPEAIVEHGLQKVAMVVA